MLCVIFNTVLLAKEKYFIPLCHGRPCSFFVTRLGLISWKLLRERYLRAHSVEQRHSLADAQWVNAQQRVWYPKRVPSKSQESLVEEWSAKKGTSTTAEEGSVL